MDIIRQLSNAFVWLIRVGTSTRVAYCYIKMISNHEEVEIYRKKIRNAIGFYILAESIWQLKDIIIYYFG